MPSFFIMLDNHHSQKILYLRNIQWESKAANRTCGHQFLLRQVLAVFLTLGVIFSSTGCTPTNSSNNSQSTEPSMTQPVNTHQLKTLKIAVIPSRSPEKQKQATKILADYLEKSLSLPVNLEVPKDYDTTINLLVEGKVQMAYLGPLSYVQARQRNSQIEPIVAPIDKLTKRPWYTSVILARANSGIKTLKDLKGKRLSFVSKSSTSGYLVPTAALLNQGLDPERDFTTVSFAGSHDISIKALVSGKVDAAATNKEAYLESQKSQKINPQQYRVIWESDPIPTSPIVISRKLPPQLIEDLKKFLLNAPEGTLDLGVDSDGFTLVQDTDYEPIRQLQSALEAKLNQSQSQ
jgi:phosphonate transport system substrate-binding protein